MKTITLLFVLVFGLGFAGTAPAEGKREMPLNFIVFQYDTEDIAVLKAMEIEVPYPEKCEISSTRSAVAPLVMFLFKAILGGIERGLAARHAARLESLSHGYSAQWVRAEFPLSDEVDKTCMALVRVRKTDTKFELLAAYIFLLKRVGDSAFTVELASMQLNQTPFWTSTRAGKAVNKANIDLGVNFTAVVPSSVPGVPVLQAYPGFLARASQVEMGKFSVPPTSTSSGAWPMPSVDAPTTIAIAITESHVDLKKEKERVALQQSLRANLWATLGEIAKAKLDD